MKDMRKSTILVYLFLIFLLAESSARVGVASKPEHLKFALGVVIVGLKDFKIDAKKVIKAEGGSIIKEILALKTLVVKVPIGEEKKFIQRIRGIPSFRFAERNGRVQAVSTFTGDWDGLVQPKYTPSDPGWGYQWNMEIIKADDAWNIHKGSPDVVIAIVDTGVDYNHVELAAHYLLFARTNMEHVTVRQKGSLG